MPEIMIFSGSANHELAKNIVEPALKGIKKLASPFVGLLYPGLIQTSQGPKVIELLPFSSLNTLGFAGNNNTESGRSMYSARVIINLIPHTCTRTYSQVGRIIAHLLFGFGHHVRRRWSEKPNWAMAGLGSLCFTPESSQ